MEVKGIKNLAVKLSNITAPKADNPSKANTTTVNSESNASRPPVENEIHIAKHKSREHAVAQEKINQVINSLNVADEAASEIHKLVKSVAGIVEQVDRPEISDTRKQTLSNEASTLVAEIKKQAKVDIASIKESPESTTKQEVAQKLEQSLKALFNEAAKSAFGIEDFSLERKENIIQVRTNVAVARERVEELRKSVADTKQFVASHLAELDVAQQNSEASQVSVRQVDEALKLATRAGNFIAAQPEQAAAAININADSLRLLE